MKKNSIYVSNYIEIKTRVQDLGAQQLLNSVVLSSFENEGIYLLGPIYIENNLGQLTILIQTLDGYDLNSAEYIGTKHRIIVTNEFKELLNNENKYLFEINEKEISVMEYDEKNSIK